MNASDSFTPDSPLVVAALASPNQGSREGDWAPDILLLHYTGMADGDSALARLCDPLSDVSCHYFVEEDGRILQLVPEARRAWHAGVSCWEGDSDVNSRSIGVEIVNGGPDFGSPDFPARQIDSVIALCRDIIARHSIRPEHVLAHSDVAPGRKRDPGEKFPWDRLHQAGVGHFVNPVPIKDGPALRPGDRNEGVAGLQELLARYGYDIAVSGVFDLRTETVVSAFQRHFRPERVDGIADLSTLTTLRDLLVGLRHETS